MNAAIDARPASTVGRLAEGATATDLVLTITQMLRRHGVVGRFVEYFGPGVAEAWAALSNAIGSPRGRANSESPAQTES